MASINFVAADAPVDNGFEPLPAGDYRFVITESDVCRNKKDTGNYLKVVLTCVEEPYAGRKVFDYLNFEHDNEKVAQIGQRQLAELCQACGMLQLEDTEELHDIEIIARLKVEEGNEQWGPSNKVKKYIEVK